MVRTTIIAVAAHMIKIVDTSTAFAFVFRSTIAIESHNEKDRKLIADANIPTEEPRFKHPTAVQMLAIISKNTDTALFSLLD